MAQLRIVNRGGRYFREYQVEPGDYLIRICLRFGHRDWRAVYDHPENAAFRARFPNPDSIDYVAPIVNLFIPLVGGEHQGGQRRGQPIGRFFIVRIQGPDGRPMPNLELHYVPPGAPRPGTSVRTDPNGELIMANPAPGTHVINCRTHRLLPTAQVSSDIPAVAVTGSGGDPGPDQPLVPDTVMTLVARETFFVECPMCGTLYQTVVRPTGGSTPVRCPRDAEDLSRIHDLILAAPSSFDSPTPTTRQNPQATPASLRTRGRRPHATSYGPVEAYWEESRFVQLGGGDYALWGFVGSVWRSVTITGRATWGASAPMGLPGRQYAFHDTPAGAPGPGAISAYTFGIPGNDSVPLLDVLYWITIHHSSKTPRGAYATARELQSFHQTNTTPPRPMADIGYHFVIDSNGAIYEGRPLGIKPTQVAGWNGGNIGIVLAGDYQGGLLSDSLSTPMLTSLELLVDVLAARFGVRSVWWHRERNAAIGGAYTECPGDDAIAAIRHLRTRYPGPPP